MNSTQGLGIALLNFLHESLTLYINYKNLIIFY